MSHIKLKGKKFRAPCKCLTIHTPLTSVVEMKGHFVALRPKSIVKVMVGRSVHLATLFLSKLEQAVNQHFVHILSLVTDNNPLSPLTYT